MLAKSFRKILFYKVIFTRIEKNAGCDILPRGNMSHSQANSPSLQFNPPIDFTTAVWEINALTKLRESFVGSISFQSWISQEITLRKSERCRKYKKNKDQQRYTVSRCGLESQQVRHYLRP